MPAWLMLIVACNNYPVETDASRYTRLVSLEAPDAEDLAACAALSGEDLRGDCGLVVARRAASAQRLPPEAYCDDIEGAVWQAECLFMAAEDHNETDEIELAAELCLRSALFSDHCSQHLWQRSLRVLTWKGGSAAFEERLPHAGRLHARWAPLLAEDTDFSVRFWRRYYEGGFERAQIIDLSTCQPLPEEDRRRCRTAGSALLFRRVQEVIRIPRAAQDLCASAPTVETLAQNGPPQFRASPDEDLDAVVVKLQSLHCRDGRPLEISAEARDLPFDPAP
ncbi:MAG: hypothetical protein ACI8S6_005959 [Myxococcota bacterium]|jgi:hypothetical protein